MERRKSPTGQVLESGSILTTAASDYPANDLLDGIATLSDLADDAISRGGEVWRNCSSLGSQFHEPVSSPFPRRQASKRRARMRTGSTRVLRRSRNSRENRLKFESLHHT
jgi:hypothetical protein